MLGVGVKVPEHAFENPEPGKCLLAPSPGVLSRRGAGPTKLSPRKVGVKGEHAWLAREMERWVGVFF